MTHEDSKSNSDGEAQDNEVHPGPQIAQNEPVVDLEIGLRHLSESTDV